MRRLTPLIVILTGSTVNSWGKIGTACLQTSNPIIHKDNIKLAEDNARPAMMLAQASTEKIELEEDPQTDAYHRFICSSVDGKSPGKQHQSRGDTRHGLTHLESRGMTPLPSGIGTDVATQHHNVGRSILQLNKGHSQEGCK